MKRNTCHDGRIARNRLDRRARLVRRKENLGYAAVLVKPCRQREIEPGMAKLERFALSAIWKRARSWRAPHKSIDGLALAFLGGHQDKVLMRRQMTLYCFLDQVAKAVRVDGVEFHGYGAEAFCAAIGLLRRPAWQVPSDDLLRRYRNPLEMNFGGWREFPQGLLDLLAGVDARWIEVAKMINEDRPVFGLHVLGRLAEKRKAGVASRDHERDVVLGGYGQEYARESVLFEPYLDVGIRRSPTSLCGKGGLFPLEHERRRETFSACVASG